MSDFFIFEREIHFYETDMMKIVHHSNYLKFAEEARVAWAFAKGFLHKSKPEDAAKLAVVQTAVRHLFPARFGDKLRTELQARRVGIRIVFEYKIWIQEGEPRLAAEIRTEHVALSESGKAEKPTAQLKSIMEKEKWTETWLSNL